jgi:hypothetical protein
MADTAISRNDIRGEGIGAQQRGHTSCVPLSFCAAQLCHLDAIPPAHIPIALIANFLLFVFGSVITHRCEGRSFTFVPPDIQQLFPQPCVSGQSSIQRKPQITPASECRA